MDDTGCVEVLHQGYLRHRAYRLIGVIGIKGFNRLMHLAKGKLHVHHLCIRLSKFLGYRIGYLGFS